jgi:subtilase family protein
MRALRYSLVCFGIVVCAQVRSAGATLDLPVREAGAVAAPFGSPAYAAEVLEIRLAPDATRAGRAAYLSAAGPGAARALRRLGVPAVDRVAAELGARFEPEFRGETAAGAEPGATDFTSFYVVHLSPGSDLPRALERFGSLREVASASAIPILPLALMPNDSLWSESWWLSQPSGLDIAAPAAWDISTGDTAIVVAVLDTGVLPYHPDLGGTVAGLTGQLWSNWAERGGAAGMDDDRNGFIDDARGWDFVDLAAAGQAAPGEDWEQQDPDPNDFAAHGTAVAGFVGALTDNARGIPGTAWRVRILPLRVGWSYPGAPSGSGEVRMDFAAQAVRYATRMGAQVITCSFANENTDGFDAAVAAAARAGITVVVSSGNFGSANELAQRSDVITVTATDRDDMVLASANLGPLVDIAAPGADMHALWVFHPGSDSIGLRQPAYASNREGTSYAAPLVAGAVTLLQADRRARGLDLLHPLAAQLRLRENADDIAAANPGNAGYGAGRLDAARALADVHGSFALAAGPTRGAAVVFRAAGATRIAYVSRPDALVLLDAVTCDTVAVTALPSEPVSGLAAAALGCGRGMGMFVALQDGRVAGFDAQGRPLAGWPTADTEVPFTGGLALGDLDGDGVLEVVGAGGDGSVWAWNAGAGVRAGFPAQVSFAGPVLPVALSQLDGAPGVEIVAAGDDGRVTVLRGNGTRLSGWPRNLADRPLAPVVMRMGIAGDTAIVIVVGNLLHAFRPNGVERPGFPVMLGASNAPGADPAVGDVDGDGSDDVVLALDAPAMVEVRDSTGSSTALPGWPRALSSLVTGPPVLAQLAVDGAPELLVPTTGGLMAFSSAAESLSSWPRFGRAGIALGVLDVRDGDEASEVLAGSGADSVFYVYDGGPGSAGSNGPGPWFTVRANFARTGSRLYAPEASVPDDIPPAAVADLRVVSATDSSLALAWAGTGGDATARCPSHYLLRAAEQPFDEAGFGQAPYAASHAATVPAGSVETAVFAGLPRGRRLWVAIEAVDASGNVSPISNLAAGQTTVGPIEPGAGLALALGANPARVPAVFYWQAAGDEVGRAHVIRIYDIGGRAVVTLAAGRTAGGVVRWDGRDRDGSRLAAGLYLARLEGGSERRTVRVVLLP